MILHYLHSLHSHFGFCGYVLHEENGISPIKIRRYPRNDTIDFQPLITKTSEILPISITVAYKGYDSEDNHILVREHFRGFRVYIHID